jgi:RNA polymerase sigma-70 factor (ECF subfamily)
MLLSCQVAMAETKKSVVGRLFTEHGGALQAFLYRRVRRPSDAAELAQEVYVRLLRVPDIWEIRDLGAYLYTVASNLARDHARRERRDGTVFDVDDPQVQGELTELPGVAEHLDAEQFTKQLREVLHQLPPKCRAAIVMQYWQGLSYEEIAQRLGVSTHMVKKYLSQAMVHCRRRMGRLGVSL